LVRRPPTDLLYQPRMIDDDQCEAVGGMRIGRGNRSTLRKPGPVPLRPPQISHDLTWARTRVATVGSRRLTARAIIRAYSPSRAYAFVSVTVSPHQIFGLKYCVRSRFSYEYYTSHATCIKYADNFSSQRGTNRSASSYIQDEKEFEHNLSTA
jgi:hypothetical protein